MVEGLEPGTTITAREVKTVEGFVLDGTPKTVKITAGSQAPELVFWNQRAGELVIRKLDSVTKEPLAGVEFELTYADGGYVDDANGHLSSNGRYTTNDAGEIRISGIVGTVVAKEVKSLPNYTIDESTRIQTVVVRPEDTQTLVFYNDPIFTQTLTIQKLITGTKDQPLAGVEFLITDSSGTYIGPNNGIYRTDEYGRITLTDLKPGTVITAKETATVDGFVLDGTPKSIEIKEGEAQTLTFYNAPIGGLELIKVSEADKSRRIKGVTFEIRKMDGALVETVTTGDNGRVHVSLDAGDYYAVEIEAAEGFKIDTTPHYFTIRDNETTSLTVTNAPFSGIILHKIDSVTGFGIYDVKFLVYDENKNPIGEYSTDDQGYIYIDDLTVQGKGKLFIRELEAAPGYELDKQYMVFSLLLEVAERYVVLAMLTIMAPLAFAMGGSKSTSEIFTGWCRMFGSMCFLMAANIVFFKMLLSVVSTVPSFLDVFLWMVLIVSIVKVAKKADEIITRIGLNPAITGNRSSLPGVIAYTVFRTALSMVTKGAANGVGGALGLAGKAASGTGKGAAGLAGTFFKGAGGAAGAAGTAAGVATGGIGAVAGAAAGGIGGAAAQAAGQRSERPRYGGGRTQTQQTNSQQEHTQQNTSQTQAGSQQQTTARERTAEGRTSGPQGASRPNSSTRRSSVQQGTKRAPSYVTPPDGQSKTEENSTPHSSSFSNTARGGGFSGSSRGGGFTRDNARGGGGSFSGSSRGGGFTKDTTRGGGFSGSATQKETATQENTSRSSGISGTRGGFSGSAAPRSGGFSKDTARSGGSSSSATQKETTTHENTSRSSGTSGTRDGGFSGSSRGGGFSKDAARGGGFSGTSKTGSSSTVHTTSNENTTTATNTSHSGTAGTGTRSSRRPAGSEPRQSRNIPPSTPTPSAGTQRSGPVQQEQRRTAAEDKPTGKGGAPVPRPGTAGTGTPSTTGRAASGAPDAPQSRTRSTRRNQGKPPAQGTGGSLKPQMLSSASGSQSGTAGTGTRSSQRPADSEPRHSRNVPPATAAPSAGAQRSGPAQQEQRRADVKDKSAGKGGAPVPRPGTAGTGPGHRTPPGQKLSGGSPTSKPDRQTNREGGTTSV